MTEKKKEQLGMSPSTASYRLVKDVLWKYIVESQDDLCSKCGEQMTRENFSLEHLTPWLDSEDPIGLYFDLNNIGFSHLKCNISSGRRPHKLSEEERLVAKTQSRANQAAKRVYNPVKRREIYERLGK